MPQTVVLVRVKRGWVPVVGATVQGEIYGAVPGAKATRTATTDADGNAVLSFDVRPGTLVETHVITGRGREWSGNLFTQELPVSPEGIEEISLGLPWETIGLGAAALSLFLLPIVWSD